MFKRFLSDEVEGDVKLHDGENSPNVSTGLNGSLYSPEDSDSLFVDSFDRDVAENAADLGGNRMYGDDDAEGQDENGVYDNDDMRLDGELSDGCGSDEDHGNDEDHDGTAVTPLGDLMLVVGADEVRIRVHSAVIRDVAPVMLTSSYEIQASEGSRAELILQEEDPEAIMLLCNIWHCTTGLTSTPTPRVMFLLAQSASKYDAISRASLMARIWIKDLSTTENTGDLWYLLVTASLMKMGDHFAALSRQLVMCHSGSFRDLIGDGEMDSMALWLALALEEARSQVRTLITEMTHSPQGGIKRVTSPSICSCDPESRQLHSWIWTAGDKFSPLDISTMTIGSIIHRIKDATAGRDWAHWPCLRNYLHVHQVSGIPASVDAGMTRITEAALGLCFECFETGNVVFGTCSHRGPDDSKIEI